MKKYLKRKDPKLLKQINKDNFQRGDAFVDEDTGSSTLINVDGKWEHDFVDDPTKP